MMEELLSQGTSPSGDSNFSEGGDSNSTNIVALDERILDIGARHSVNVLRTPPTKKAKRVRFFRNGDKFYTGVVIAVTPERYRSFDSLASDLTRALISSVTLPNGVRAIYTMDGRKVQSIGDLEDGKCYVVSGQGEIFKKVEYSSSKVRRGSSLSGLPQSPAGTGRQISAIPLCVKARIVTLIRHGTKPRKVMRLLLNKRNAPSLEHVMEAITEVVKLDSGAVRKVYALSGQQVTSLEQFFENDDIFLAYGTEKSSQEDFELDFEESKSVQSFRRCPWMSKRQNGPMPRMPRKSGKKVLVTPQVRTPSPSSLILPQPLRLHYAVGHVIGDGNFAVVRHCVHKTTGAEYAMKIVDKYKCQGKETMLASEVDILRKVCHPNIISFIAEQETADQLFLVMELVKGGDLFDAIAAATKFSEAEASVMIGHLTSALAYLHSHYIVHRDVKPENLLVEMDGSHVRCLKLGDFGLAQVAREPLYTVCGTPTYVAPEILAETGYGLKIDVWAAGVILYILLCGFPPFVSPENEQEELFERILSGQYEFTPPYWDAVSNSAKQLISNMLQAQPELRFSAEDVLDHPWLAQSFLGGKQTTTTASTDSSEQYWNQQCKPIKLATFEFDFKKQRQNNDTEEEAKETDGARTNRRSKWNTRPSSVDVGVLSSESKNNVVFVEDRDEIDFTNGSNNEGEPVSLSNDCLQDIHSLSQSMHNLIINLNENPDLRHRLKSSHSTTSSISSIPENVSSSMRDTNLTTYNHHGSSSSIYVRMSPSRSDKSVIKKDSMNKRNGNSLNDIYSVPTTPETPRRKVVGEFETPKSHKVLANRRHSKRKCLYDNVNLLSPNLISNYGSDDMKNCNAVSSSTDSFTGSSSNDIETSDSFVNIQFAQLAYSRKSSSTQSMESTDSFENISFSRNQDLKNDNASDPNENNYEKVVREENPCFDASYLVCVNQEKSIAKVSKTKNNVKTIGTSKVPRPCTLLSSDNKRTSNNSATKTQEISRNVKSEVVRFREDRSVKNQAESKNIARNKRFSYFSPCNTKRTVEAIDTIDAPIRTITRDDRKFNSTDELRDDKQQKQVKSKRFSLYYTPQPLRKTYEAEIKLAGKNTCKNSSVNRNDRPNNGRPSDDNKKKEEITEGNEQKNTRNRRSVVSSSTVVNRNKSNKQNVQIRPNNINSNLQPGRTK